MAHLLILESWLEGHGRVLPRLLRRLGHTWTLVTRNPDHYRLPTGEHPIVEWASAVEVVETNDLDTVRPVLRRLRADGLFTVCDYYLEHVQRLAADLGLPAAYSPAVAIARDKARTRALLDAAGVPNPPYLLTSSLSDALSFAAGSGYPLVVKPADLASSAFVSRVDSPADLAGAFGAIAGFRRNFRGQDRAPAALLEGFLRGPEFSVEAVGTGDRTEILGVTDKRLAGDPYFIEVGHQFPAALPPAEVDEICEFVRRCLDAIGFTTGVSHTEVKLTPNGPRLVEINPRPGGNYIVDLVRSVTGIDQLELQIAAALGQPYRPDRAAPRVRSAASALLIPPHGGTITGVSGVDSARAVPGVTDLELFVEPPSEVDDPVDNGSYLGMLLAVDRDGLAAGKRAATAAGRVRFEMAASARERAA